LFRSFKERIKVSHHQINKGFPGVIIQYDLLKVKTAHFNCALPVTKDAIRVYLSVDCLRVGWLVLMGECHVSKREHLKKTQVIKT